MAVIKIVSKSNIDPGSFKICSLIYFHFKYGKNIVVNFEKIPRSLCTTVSSVIKKVPMFAFAAGRTMWKVRNEYFSHLLPLMRFEPVDIT